MQPLTPKGLLAKLVTDFLNSKQEILSSVEKIDKKQNDLKDQFDSQPNFTTPQVVEEMIAKTAPIKGKDYYTEDDVQNLVDAVVGQIKVPKVGVDFYTKKDRNQIKQALKEELSKEVTKSLLESGALQPKIEQTKETAQEVVDKLNTLKGALKSDVIQGLPTIQDFLRELKDPKGKNKLYAQDILNMPGKGRLDQRWHGGGLSEVFHDNTLAGKGTADDPLIVVGGGGGSPGGNDTDVQFNDSGAFGGSDSFTFDKTVKVLTVEGSTNDGSSNVLILRNSAGNVIFNTDSAGKVGTGTWQGTPVELTYGGTGASLGDPGLDSLWGWDDTDGSIVFINIGTGLSYDHSTHTLSATGTQPVFVNNEVVSGSGTTFTLGATPLSGTEHIYGNGQRLTPGGVDYTITGAVVTTVNNFNAGDILADYQTS